MDSTKIVNLVFKAQDEASGAIDTIHESLGSIAEVAGGMILGNLGLDSLAGLGDFAKGLVTSNMEIETLDTSLTGLYDSATEAGQALEYMTQFSLKNSLNREDVLAAGQEIADYGQDITQVLPALGNVAAYMGVALPAATQAMEMAMTGRFQTLTHTLHITRAEMEAFGLSTSKTIDPANFLAAFEALSAAKFGGGMAAQAQTLSGQFAELKDQLVVLEEEAGHPIFEGLKAAMTELQTIIGNASAAWTIFSHGIATAFATDGPLAQTALQNMMNVVGTFSAFIQNQFNAIKNEIAGSLQIAWGLLQIVFGGGLALLSGNWSDFERTFNAGAQSIQQGMINLTAGLLEGVANLATELVGAGATMMLPVANALLGPWTQLARGIRDVFSGIAPFVGAVVGGIAAGVTAVIAGVMVVVNGVILAVNTAMKAIVAQIDSVEGMYNGLVGKIPGLGSKLKIGETNAPQIQFLTPPNAINTFSTVNDAVQNALKSVGINQNQSIVAGRTQAQAAADLANQQQAIIGPMLAGLEQQRKNLLQEYGGGTGGAQSRGSQLLDALDKAINQLLHGKLPGGGEVSVPAGGLPAQNWMSDPTTAATTIATALKSAGISGTGSTGAINAGQLSASFGSTLAMVNGSIAGSPMARTAANSDKQTTILQQRLAIAQQELTQRTQQLQQAQQQIALLTAISTGIRLMATALQAPGIGPSPVRMLGGRSGR